MSDKVKEGLQLAWSVLASFRDIDWEQVSFGSLGLAFGVSLFLLVVLLYKILWGKNKFYYYYSGHKIPVEYDESKTFHYRLICMLPKFLLALSIIFMLIALANPYLPRTKIETVVESREVIALLDNSSSMGWPLGSTQKPACEVVRKAYLKFLKLRRGHNDRVALLVFSNNAYIKQDFIVDDDIYRMQVEDTPCVMVNAGHSSLPENDPNDLYLDIVASRDKVMIVESEAGTNLVAGLKAVIKYFDQKGRKDVNKKSLIMVTDAAVEADPEEEFKELKKRKITPYIIHVKPNEVGEKQFNNQWKLEIAEALKKQVKQYGGMVFNVEDQRSAELAYAAINKLETAPLKIVRHMFKVLIFQRPLMVAIALAILSIISGIFVGFVFEEFP